MELGKVLKEIRLKRNIGMRDYIELIGIEPVKVGFFEKYNIGLDETEVNKIIDICTKNMDLEDYEIEKIHNAQKPNPNAPKPKVFMNEIIPAFPPLDTFIPEVFIAEMQKYFEIVDLGVTNEI